VTKEFMLNAVSESLLNENFVKYIKFVASPWMYELLSAFPETLKSERSSSEINFNLTFADFLGSKP